MPESDNLSQDWNPRLWPGIVLGGLIVGLWLLVPVMIPEYPEISDLGGLLAGFLIFVWWTFFSRVPWLERLGVMGFIILAIFLTSFFIDKSIATGMMGMMFPAYAIQVVGLALVAWAIVSLSLSANNRRLLLAGLVAVSCAAFTVIRTGGFTGGLDHDLAWRWSETPEEKLLADDTNALGSEAVLEAEAVAEWPGFRGPERDGVVRNARINTDWTATPPAEIWRRSVGPGWSSFAVQGDFIFTQEQRGEEEVVSCYQMSTGEPVWHHRDDARFWESNAGAGPRGTPTLSKGQVYSFGGTGIVNVLNASDGSLVWSRNAAEDTKTTIPGWGFSSSPLVIDDLVVVAASGALVAYDRADGMPRWYGPKSDGGYSSPHLIVIDSIPQVLLMRGAGATSVSPSDGKVLWEHSLPSGSRIVQPALIADGEILVSLGDKSGMRRISVSHVDGKWQTEERWTTNRLKPYYNDFVVHNGYAYGFDGSILACINVEDGKRQWKGGRYGYGQLVLLADQDLLLVLSEKGDLALVSATPDKFTEQARMPAINGKTWNHPVLVSNVLLVRNGEEMAAFRMAGLPN